MLRNPRVGVGVGVGASYSELLQEGSMGSKPEIIALETPRAASPGGWSNRGRSTVHRLPDFRRVHRAGGDSSMKYCWGNV